MKQDARWEDVRADLESVTRHASYAKELLAMGQMSDADFEGYKTQMAFLQSMHCARTSLEMAQSRIKLIIRELQDADGVAALDAMRAYAVREGGNPIGDKV